MNKLILLLVVFLLTPSVLAGPVAYGYIHIEIINAEPVLEELRLSADYVYHDTDIDCLANVIDNDPDEAVINKRWYVNGEEVDEPDFEEGDEVECLLIPVDKWGLEGAEYSISFKVQDSPEDIKLAQSFYELLGNDKSTEELIATRERNAAAVTGLVTSGNGERPSAFLMVFLAIGIMLVATIRVAAKRKIKNLIPNGG